MKKTNRIILLVLLSLSLCVIVSYLCYRLAEKYFFDKFFYQKSNTHGYVLSEENFNFLDYGDRGKDLSALNNLNELKGEILQNQFRIAIIGDSHVWGQGVRNNQRFAKLLEKRLNKIRPTRVFSYGKRGNNTLDYYNSYQRISNLIFANLYIILPVTNDAILNKSNTNDPITNNCQKKYINEKPTYFIEDFPIDSIINQSWKNPINQCVVDQSIQLLPKDNAIFLIDKDYHRDNTQFDYYHQLLTKNNKTTISTSIGKYMDKYKRYFDEKVYMNFSLSPTDPHPNALANQMYSDILFSEITTNPKWSFIEK
ncbi:MAG TPA: hypothetical protein VN174_01660 [Candidatus Methanoperedens sp.]|nr:hypothetical protein [Candidatus Methanoperedens sp.]